MTSTDHRLPIKIDSTSNGEYEPVPLRAPARHANQLAEQAIDEAARRLGLPRRRYLVSGLGAAATLAAADVAFAAAGMTGGRYRVPSEAPFELAAADQAIGGDEFIFDVQLHHVDPSGPWRKRGNWEAVLRNFPNAACGLSDAVECFSAERLLKDVFFDSDTAMGVLSHVPGAREDNPLDFATASATRRRAGTLDGTERLFLHGRVMANLPGEIESMDEQAASERLVGFKTYTQFGPGGGYFLDDERVGLPFIERARALKVKNICVHKGLLLGSSGQQFATCRDIGPVARRYPEMNFLIYHAGFNARAQEGAYKEDSNAGIDILVRSLKENGVRHNVYAELGSTWRYLMREPDQAAHVLGKLLLHLGEDQILWGTDSIWYGSPQDQIQAFRAFEISSEFQQRYGYPALTKAVKAKIFGLNAARVYGLETSEIRRKLARDKVQRSKLDYLNDPAPDFKTFGPRNRREFLAFRRLHGDSP